MKIITTYLKSLFFVLLNLIATITLYANAKNSIIEKIGVGEKLSNEYVTGVAQDNNGFMWFATEDGLNRFDGNSIITFRNNPNDPTSISDNAINMILADDRNNCLWIATQFKGLSRFDLATRQFRNYPSGYEQPYATGEGGVISLALGDKNRLWIGTYGDGLKCLDIDADSIIHCDETHIQGFTKEYGFIWSITESEDGYLYVGHLNEGLSVVNLKDRSFTNFRVKAGSIASMPANRVNEVYIDSGKRVWLSTSNGLVLFDKKNNEFTTIRRDRKSQNSLLSDDISSVIEYEGELWIGSYDGGISVLNLSSIIKNNESIFFENTVAGPLPQQLSNPNVKKLLKDRFGNVWIATHGGINFISHKESFFKYIQYLPIVGNLNSLTDKTVRSVTVGNQGELWVGLNGGGIDRFQDGVKVKNYNTFSGNLPDNHLLSAYSDSQNNIWFGAESGGILLYDRTKDRFDVFAMPVSDSGTSYVRCIYEDASNNIWFGSDKRIIVYNLHTKESTIIESEKLGIKSNLLVRSISQDKNGHIWIGSQTNGLLLLDSSYNLLKKLDVSSNLNSNRVNFILKDKDDNMWVGLHNGLVCYDDVDSMSFRKIDQASGLNNDFIRSIAEGKDDEIWIGTNSGLSRYQIKKGKVYNYEIYNNRPLGMFSDGAVAKSKEGTVFFGAQDGVCFFDTREHPDNFTLPPIQITNFEVVDNKQNNIRTINSSNNYKVKLKYNQNSFTISYSLMDFALKNHILYTYRLKGWSDMWFESNRENQVTFRNIPTGKYEFTVYPSTVHSEYTENQATVTIIVSPPLWLTWWAKSLYFLLTGFIIFQFIRFYKRRIDLENQLYWEKENHKREKQLNDEKLLFFTNITHELRTPLTLIMGPLEDLISDSSLAENIKTTIAVIHKSASRLTNLISQILEFRKTETQSRELCVSYDDISAWIEGAVVNYKELNKTSELSIQVIDKTTDSKLFFDSEVLTIILDNLLSNAIKFTDRGVVEIILNNKEVDGEKSIEIEISDSGSGIPPEELEKIFDRYYRSPSNRHNEGTGIGLSLVKSMVELHEGTVRVESVVGEGTSFWITLSMENSYPDAKHMENKAWIGDVGSSSELPLMLVVEDNLDIREYIVKSFEDNYEIIEAENGEQGGTLALERIPDIIISDIMMPIVDGIQMIKVLKNDIRTSHIPIVLLTAKDSLQSKTEGYSIGADSYITKPFSANLLKARVKNIVETREAVKNNALLLLDDKDKDIEVLGALDNEFLQNSLQLIEENLSKENFGIQDLADLMFMSHSTFYRKIKSLTGLTATEFVRKAKMKRAEKMLLSDGYTISEVAYKTGFSGASSFRKAFRAEFGVPPTEYIQTKQNKTNI